MATLHPASILMEGVSEDATLRWLILKNKVKENEIFVAQFNAALNETVETMYA